jgi:hypothetical protein
MDLEVFLMANKAGTNVLQIAHPLRESAGRHVHRLGSIFHSVRILALRQSVTTASRYRHRSWDPNTCMVRAKMSSTCHCRYDTSNELVCLQCKAQVTDIRFRLYYVSAFRLACFGTLDEAKALHVSLHLLDQRDPEKALQ